MMSPRDMLLINKKGYNSKGLYDVCTSIDSLVVPELPGTVRVKVLVGGYFIEHIED